MSYNNNFNNYSNPYANNLYQRPASQIFFVNGLDGAKQYPVFANQSVLLMDNTNPIIYSKKANNLGQVTLECYKIVSITEDEINNVIQEQKPKEYVYKDELDELKTKIDTLSSKFDTFVKGSE